MPLIKSVSGIRGTIGGHVGENLTPADIVSFASAYGTWMKTLHPSPLVVVGRDGRISGQHVSTLVIETLRALGVHVIDAGLSTTPSIEMYVPHVQAQGGIMISASHNPREWNALKFFNAAGEFISAQEGENLLKLAEVSDITFAPVDTFGSYQAAPNDISHHVDSICALPLVQVETIRKRKFHVVADCINSTGAIGIPALLDALGCTFTLLNDAINGEFAHNPEPLKEHLTDLSREVLATGAILGIAVDPDVDRLALVDETGNYIGEEYTLVTAADYVLRNTPGPVVSNLSSSLALRDLVEKHGQQYTASKVGEVHVVVEMKSVGAVIGGEGNGGVIYPELHYGRDALVGIALILSHLATSGKTLSELRSGYPEYVMAKHKVLLPPGTKPAPLLKKAAAAYRNAEKDTRDGVKILLDKAWIHLRASNTEPILRVYTEAATREEAEKLAQEAVGNLKKLVKG